jgi:hypothetical protein
VNAGVLRPLLRASARAVNWLPLVVGALLGLAIVLVPEALTTKLTDAHLVDLIRVAAACTALGTAFLLDDPASRSTPTVPTSRLTRNLVRVAVAVPAIALWWVATLTLARTAHRPHATHLPAAALTVEAAALIAAALALAATAQRHTTDGNTGVIAAPATLVLAAAIWFLPRRVALVTAPGEPHWTASHYRWAGLLAAAVVAFLWTSHERTRRPAAVGRVAFAPHGREPADDVDAASRGGRNGRLPPTLTGRDRQ